MTAKSRDIDIRKTLHEILDVEFKDDPTTRIVDELALCQGEARVDVAVINGALHGYEIKSDSDTLERLPKQIEVYSRVLDKITIVTGKSHIQKVCNLIPYWWGIEEAEHISNEKVEIRTYREPLPNPTIDPYSVIQLLWRDEAVELLKSYNLARGFLTKPRQEIWKRAAENIPMDVLQQFVRRRLKTRCNWRAEQ